MCATDNKPHTSVVEVEDTEIVQDEGITDKQSDKLEEESTSPKLTTMESVHDREVNMEKTSPSHDSKSQDRMLKTPTIPFDSVSPSCEYIDHGQSLIVSSVGKSSSLLSHCSCH